MSSFHTKFGREVILGSIAGIKPLGGSHVFSLKEEWRLFFQAMLVIFAALLMFGGPTYLMFVLQKLDISYPFIVLLGLASLVLGAILFTRLIREERT